MNNIIELKKFKEKKLNSPDDNEKCNNNYKAEKKFSGYISDYIKNPDDLIMEAQKYLQKGLYNEAISLFEGITKKYPDINEAYYYLAVSYIRKNDLKKAISVMTDVLKRCPDDAEIRMLLAETCLEAGNYKNAIKNIDFMLAKNPSDVEAHNLMGISYMSLGNFTRALGCFKNCKKINRYFLHAYMNSGMCYLNTGNYDFAILEFKKTLNINPDLTESLFNIGYASVLINNFEEGRDCLSKCIISEHKIAQCFMLIGYSYIREGLPEKALEHYLKIKNEMKIESSEVLTGIGMSYYYMMDIENAKKYLNLAIKSEKSEFLAHYFLGRIFFEKNEFQISADHLRTSLSYEYDFLDAKILLGDILYQQGNIENALNLWNEAYLKEPYNKEIKNKIDSVDEIN